MKIENKLPNINLGAEDNIYSALMQIIETYLNLYITTCIPVIVDKYEKGFVDVKPVLKKTTVDGQPIKITDDDIIYNVPMMKLKSNGWKLNFIAKKGDYGLLIASKYDISNYKKEHKETELGSHRTFSLSDSFYLPLDWDGEENESGFVISKGNTELTLGENDVTIKGTTVNVNADTANINSGSVNLGMGVGQGVARIGDEVDLQTGKIITGSAFVKAAG
jgi:hypothetical protein